MTTTDKTKELKTELDKVSNRISTLRDDLLSFQSDFKGFREGVVKDLKNIVEYLGKQKDKN